MVLELHPVARKAVELLEPHIERQGFELVAVQYKRGTHSSILRLLVDRPEGGVSMGDLERLSPIIGDLLERLRSCRGTLHAGGRFAWNQPAAGQAQPL